MDKNQIFITSGTEYKRMTKELLEKRIFSPIMGIERKNGTKPNLASPSEVSWGAMTHPGSGCRNSFHLKEYGYSDAEDPGQEIRQGGFMTCGLCLRKSIRCCSRHAEG